MFGRGSAEVREMFGRGSGRFGRGSGEDWTGETRGKRHISKTSDEERKKKVGTRSRRRLSAT